MMFLSGQHFSLNVQLTVIFLPILSIFVHEMSKVMTRDLCRKKVEMLENLKCMLEWCWKLILGMIVVLSHDLRPWPIQKLSGKRRRKKGFGIMMMWYKGMCVVVKYGYMPRVPYKGSRRRAFQQDPTDPSTMSRHQLVR